MQKDERYCIIEASKGNGKKTIRKGVVEIGLDMYLMCNSKAVTKAAWDNDVEQWRVIGGQCAYWRKSNAIHKWFVDNVQEGRDDCGSYDVEVEQLRELLDTVDEVLGSTKLVDGKVINGYTFHDGKEVANLQPGMVLEDTSVARSLLPTQDGFFFGGTEYDQWYWEDLEYTRDQLARILDSMEKVEYEPFEGCGFTFKSWMPKGERDWEVKFQYRSSW